MGNHPDSDKICCVCQCCGGDRRRTQCKVSEVVFQNKGEEDVTSFTGG